MSGAWCRWLASCAAIAAVVSGCGSSTPSASGVQTLLAGTSAALDAAHTFRITIDGTGHYKGRPTETLHGEGVVDWSAGSLDLQITGAGQSERLVILPGAAYIHGALSAEAMKSTHRSWLKVSSNGHTGDNVLGGLDPVGDPLTTLSSLVGHLTDVTSSGEKHLDGVATTELSGSVAKSGDAATVWIDHEGRVRQLDMVSTGATAANITERFSNYGVPVHVAAPPANRVVNFDKLPRTQQAM
jgi:hypothetical protein